MVDAKKVRPGRRPAGAVRPVRAEGPGGRKAGRKCHISDATWSAALAALMVLIAAVKEVILLWIRAKYRWQNGTSPSDKGGKKDELL